MFESLSDRIKADDAREINQTERVLRWIAVTVVSIVVFGGLYFGVSMLE
jgi:hypothetical protein